MSAIWRRNVKANLLNQLRQRGIKVSLVGSKIKFSPNELLTDKVRCWLIKYKDPLLVLIKKEHQQLRNLIENVSRHANGTNEDLEELFDYAMKHLGLEGAIMSYKATARSQARIVSLGYNNPVFCRTCQKHILLGRESCYEVNYCPYCENK
jgi:hypothetical protein